MRQYNRDVTLTYTPDQAGMLTQTLLVMFIATALNARFAGRFKDRKDQRLFLHVYLVTLAAILANVTVILFGQKLPISNIAFWVVVTVTVIAIFYNALILLLHAFVLLRGLREPVIDPNIKTCAQECEKHTQTDKRRWIFHVEYQNNTKPRNRRNHHDRGKDLQGTQQQP